MVPITFFFNFALPVIACFCFFFLFVLVSFFVLPLCCQSFFDLRILITSLVFSNFLNLYDNLKRGLRLGILKCDLNIICTFIFFKYDLLYVVNSPQFYLYVSITATFMSCGIYESFHTITLK